MHPGWTFWRETLKSARYVMAPMVDHSDLAFRLLGRRHGVGVAYSPMINARVYVHHPKFRAALFSTCAEDRPLIAQLAGDCPDSLLAAAHMLQDQCDAIELNLGCPQNIARRGHYGSYLQDEWPLIDTILRTLVTKVTVPVLAKIRIFQSHPRTLDYVRMLEQTGISLLTVHGRTREQRGHNTGLATWSAIADIVNTVSLPVVANGNVLTRADAERCLQATGAVAVMSAEGLLYNPFMFDPAHRGFPVAWQVATEYRQLVQQYETPLANVRGHLFKIYRAALTKHTDLRERFGQGDQAWLLETSLELDQRLQAEYEAARQQGQDPSQYSQFHDGSMTAEEVVASLATVPHWYCTPYVRPPLAASCL